MKMAGGKQPIDLILLKGKKHLTKKEIEERIASEVKAPNDKVEPPSYLSAALKKEFTKIAEQLIDIKIMTNLDVDALARFIQVQKMYIDITKELMKRKPITTIEIDDLDQNGNIIGKKKLEMPNDTFTELLSMQDKLFKQCRSAASDLGLTISSRVKLVIPKSNEEKKPPTKEEKLFGDAL
jgi:P27 family predicted phage terminase small subunit